MWRALQDRTIAVACWATQALCRIRLIGRARESDASEAARSRRRLDPARAATQARRAIARRDGDAETNSDINQPA